MRGAIIHGVLLAVMLVYGYRTWTRDKTIKPDIGSVVLWDSGEVVAVEYNQPLNKIVKIEKKGDYWWGTDTSIQTREKPGQPAQSQGSAAGSAAGSGSGAGSALSLPPPPEREEIGRKTSEFPLGGETSDKVTEGFQKGRAMRDLGKPSADDLKQFKLVDAKTTLTVTFANGSKREFLVGDTVYGNQDRYVLDKQSGKAYVLSRELLSGLQVGGPSLQLTDPRGFDVAKVDAVTIDAPGKSRSAIRVQSGGAEGKQVKTWGEPDSKKPNLTLANFIDNVTNNLKPMEYAAQVKPSDLTQIIRMTYKDDRGRTLGTLTLSKRAKPGTLEPGQELDPANPPPPEIEYYIVTEKTRVPAIVRRDIAEKMETDIDTVFASKPEEPGKSQVDPTKAGNPFGNGPLPAPTPTPGPGPDPHAGLVHPPPPPAPPVPTPTPAAGSAH